MKCHQSLVLQGHYQVWDKNNLQRTSFTSLFLINQEKYKVSALARGGRQDFNFTFFCHIARPVSLILNFIAQKVRGGRKCRIENLLWLAQVGCLDMVCILIFQHYLSNHKATWQIFGTDLASIINYGCTPSVAIYVSVLIDKLAMMTSK